MKHFKIENIIKGIFLSVLGLIVMTADANALTAGRKTYILNQIDTAIGKI